MALQSRPAPPATRSYPPNPTLFLGNLPQTLKKEDLRRSLFMLFTTYGHVLDVVNMRTGKLRGVAHVTFRDTSESTQAMRACQGFDFFGKPMRIAYAKQKSDIFAKIEGKFEIPSTAQHTANEGAAGGMTDIQKAVFGGGAPANKMAGAPGTSTAPPSALPAPPPAPGTAPPAAAGATEEAKGGAKRPREEESEGEDDDAMDVSDSD